MTVVVPNEGDDYFLFGISEVQSLMQLVQDDSNDDCVARPMIGEIGYRLCLTTLTTVHKLERTKCF